jgi:hypothetical protein
MARQYSELVRLLRLTVLLAAMLACAFSTMRHARAQATPAAAKDQMFSGALTAVTDSSLTVVRTNSTVTKTFAITPQTQFEGPKPRVSLHVTIRYISGDEGDRAVRVIVKAPAPPAKK